MALSVVIIQYGATERVYHLCQDLQLCPFCFGSLQCLESSQVWTHILSVFQLDFLTYKIGSPLVVGLTIMPYLNI